MSLRVEILTGPNLQRHLAGLAALRIEVFREWPYLYQGSLEYEGEYLRAFANAPGAVIVGAFAGDALAGASTAAPMAAQADYVTAPFRALGLDLSEYFYFGESVLKREYRNQGLGVRFFVEREVAARADARTKYCTFSAVVRDAADPRRPSDYRPLDDFWRRRGFEPWPGVTCKIPWTELGAAAETEQDMQFWRKTIR
jgi:GNAT superfamily N-acetyltransferase